MNIQICSNYEYSKYNYYRQVDKGCVIPDMIASLLIWCQNIKYAFTFKWYSIQKDNTIYNVHVHHLQCSFKCIQFFVVYINRSELYI